MTVLRVVVLISLMAFTVTGQQKSAQRPFPPPASCPVTVPPAIPFIPPAPYELEDNNNDFWIGTDHLWTARSKTEVWTTAPRKPGHEQEVQPLTAKIFWGSVDFNYKEEYPPKLRVTGRRLDGDAPPLLSLPTTNAFPGPRAAMLTGVYVPTPGCWEITGEYKGQRLSFVVWVTQLRWDDQ